MQSHTRFTTHLVLCILLLTSCQSAQSTRTPTDAETPSARLRAATIDEQTLASPATPEPEAAPATLPARAAARAATTTTTTAPSLRAWRSTDRLLTPRDAGAEALRRHPPAASAPPANLTYTVATWNLEHFSRTKSRGFPENTSGGPTYGPRKAADLQTIANVIRRLDIKILLLQEIAADKSPEGGKNPYSAGLESLVAKLGGHYDYELSRAGDDLRTGILYDKRFASLELLYETDFPNVKVEGKSLFDRQPVFAYFKLLHNGQPMNDLIVCNVHLASLQNLARNHDAAVAKTVRELLKLRDAGEVLPSGENDLLIAGDFNCNRFDNYHEEFWDELESNGWDVLADSPSYKATRLSGNPLGLNRSKIDYFIVSSGNGGLAGQEITQDTATVNFRLIGEQPFGGSTDEFRKRCSDHIPVTVKVRVITDDD